jgi:CRP/FNR family transcriptional regulator, cyclic AMP receptor protein
VAIDSSELQAAPILAHLEAAQLESLSAGAERLEIPAAGTELTHEGDFGHCMFVILDGTAEVSVEGRVVRELRAGDLFGEIAVTASGRRTADVVAKTPMTLASVFKRDVWALEQANPGFAEELRKLRDERT